MSKKNKKSRGVIGLKNTWIAPIIAIDDTKTDGTGYSYGTPFACPGARSLNLTHNMASQSYAADDDPNYINLTADLGYDGNFEFTRLPQEFFDEILHYVNGLDDMETQPSDFALWYDFENIGATGEVVKGKQILWHITITKKPDVVHNTKDNNLAIDGHTISIKVIKRKDCKHGSGTSYEDEPAYTAFTNSSVPQPADFVAEESVTISGNGEVTAGETLALTATTVPANTALTWTSSDTDVATVSNGTVTGVAAGTVTITAAFASDPTVKATKTVTVTAVTDPGE